MSGCLEAARSGRLCPAYDEQCGRIKELEAENERLKGALSRSLCREQCEIDERKVAEAEVERLKGELRNDPNVTPLFDKYVEDIQALTDKLDIARQAIEDAPCPCITVMNDIGMRVRSASLPYVEELHVEGCWKKEALAPTPPSSSD